MAANRRGDLRPGRGIRIITAVIAVLALLPLAYVFNGFREASEQARQFITVQRTGAGYIRPLTTLLAALVDGQGAAVRGTPVVSGAVREAIEQVSVADSTSGDRLGVRQRWSQLRAEIESALSRAATGPDAMGVFAEPIGLTQALFSRIGDASMIARDPVVDAQYLIDTAVVGVPEMIVSAGVVGGLAAAAESGDSRIAVALDRISRAAQAIRGGPGSGADEMAAGQATMSLLQPLDEFSAAVDGLIQAASVPSFKAGEALANLDRELRRVRQAAVGLDVAALDALDTLLQRRVVELDIQRRNMVIAGVLIPIAAAVVLWLVWLGSEGSSRRPADPEGVSQRLEPDRLGPELVGTGRVGAGLATAGRAAHTLRPREAR